MVPLTAGPETGTSASAEPKGGATRRTDVSRIVIIGNAGGGKSTLARAIAAARHVPHFEIDRLLWQPGWHPTPKAGYDAEHSKVIARESWIIDGLGRQDSIAPRIERAGVVILIDMPVWMHFWLAAERQIEWSRGSLDHPPGNLHAMPPTEALFRTIWEVDQSWMPMVRELCRRAERNRKTLHRLKSVAELNGFAQQFATKPLAPSPAPA